MPDPVPTAVILSKLVRTHKQEVSLFNEYHAVNRACKKVISRLIPDKYYKSLSSQIIGFSKVACLQILTHLITEYAELDDTPRLTTPIRSEERRVVKRGAYI